jgi:hypothetical protein
MSDKRWHPSWFTRTSWFANGTSLWSLLHRCIAHMSTPVTLEKQDCTVPVCTNGVTRNSIHVFLGYNTHAYMEIICKWWKPWIRNGVVGKPRNGVTCPHSNAVSRFEDTEPRCYSVSCKNVTSLRVQSVTEQLARHFLLNSTGPLRQGCTIFFFTFCTGRNT